MHGSGRTRARKRNHVKETAMTTQTSMTQRLEAMLASGRDDKLLRYTLGKAYVEAESYAKACDHLETCVAYDPQYSVAWKWLGKARLGLGDPEGARHAWERASAVAAEHGDAQVMKEVAVFLRRLDKPA
jgi:predicted Zn-dependent protease